MADNKALKKAIADAIKLNINKEITGSVLQSVMLSVVNSMGASSGFAGLAKPDTNPLVSDANVYYFATEVGVYPNFNAASIGESDGLCAFVLNSQNTWDKLVLGAGMESILERLRNLERPVTGTGATKTSKIKGVYYVPRKSKDNFWLANWIAGDITTADIVQDLIELKSTCDVNTIRIFTFYDIEYRKLYDKKIAQGSTPTQAAAYARENYVGLTDGFGSYKQAVWDKLSEFIDLCKANGLDVIPTLFQELKALKPTDSWQFLENELTYFQAFTAKMITMLKSKSNVSRVILKNEPDGYGVWDDESLAKRVMVWLNKIKDTAVAIAPNIKYLVNTVTHDNLFKRVFNVGTNNSVYTLSDEMCMNSFLWADTGFWSGVNYRTQFDYVRSRNYLKKAVILTECGFPSNYASQAVLGSPLLNEDGSLAGGNATYTDESLVPVNDGIFDRPKGRTGGIGHSEENQRLAVAEALYWAEFYNFDGVLVWSAYDHSTDSYRDPFGLITFGRTAKDATKELASVFTCKLNSAGKKHLSLVQGAVTGTGKINGLQAFEANKTVPIGVYLENGGSWLSDELMVDVPCNLRLTVTITGTLTDEPVTFGIVTPSASIQFRYKKYTTNKFQCINPNGEYEYGFSQVVTPVVGQAFTFDLDLSALQPKARFNSTLLAFSGHGNDTNQQFKFTNWQLETLKLQVFAGTTLQINKLELVGEPLSDYIVNPKHNTLI